MFGKILKQQITLISYRNSVILFSIIAIIVGVSPFQDLEILKSSEDLSTLLSKIFNSFILCFGLIFISLIVSLNTNGYRSNDLLLTKTRIGITTSIIIRITLIQLIVWVPWAIASLATITLTGFGFFIIFTKFQILILYLYAFFVIILLSLIELNILMITNSKILALIIAMAINFFEYYLLKVNIDSLLYYFTTPKSLLGILIRFMIILVLIILLIFSLNKTILKKDF